MTETEVKYLRRLMARDAVEWARRHCLQLRNQEVFGIIKEWEIENNEKCGGEKKVPSAKKEVG